MPRPRPELTMRVAHAHPGNLVNEGTDISRLIHAAASAVPRGRCDQNTTTATGQKRGPRCFGNMHFDVKGRRAARPGRSRKGAAPLGAGLICSLSREHADAGEAVRRPAELIDQRASRALERRVQPQRGLQLRRRRGKLLNSSSSAARRRASRCVLQSAYF